MVVVGIILGIGLGAGAAWLALRGRWQRLELELAHERSTGAEKIALLEAARGGFETTIKALAADALRSNNESFLELARTQLDQKEKAVEHLVKPLRESLEKVNLQAQALEQARRQAYGALNEQLRSVVETQERLRGETSNLVTALRAPHVRGRWGEMQLKRVVELAGMVAYCDFVEQESTHDADGHLLRPDLVIKLPGGKNVVVDSKVPLDAYLDGILAQDDDLRLQRFRDHARQVRDHITKLGAKKYWQQFAPAPDLVIMFLPDETFFRAAQEQDPSLVEAGVNSRVMPASPLTLITILQSIASTWQQETVAESARTVNELGRELYDRLSTMGKHFAKLGRSLDGAVGAYNETIGSIETRVLVTARKFPEHGIVGDDVPALQPIEKQARPLQALELAEPDRPVELPRSGQNAA
jgi:DNA recombination protein RmuC